jgi:glycosyltransferase involved in cell wall biosynthesis
MPLPIKLISYPLLYLQHRLKLKKTIKDIKPDIAISTFSYEAAILPKIKQKFVRILEFHHSKGYKTTELTNRNLSWIQNFILKIKEKKERQLLPKYDRFVVLTDEDKHSWGNPENCTVIPNMNPISSNANALLNNKKALALGRLTYQKGFDLLIKIWEPIARKHPDWQLDIVGDGEEKEHLSQLINKRSLNKQISLRPYTSDVKSEYFDHSLFILSSRHEGFGLTLVEAMSCGVPCIAFDCKSGPNEIIKDREDGFLIAPDDLDTMSRKIELLIENEELRKQLGHNAKKNAERFSEHRIMEKWTTLFNNIKKG